MTDTGYSARHGKVIMWAGRILFVLFAGDNNNWAVHTMATPEQGWFRFAVAYGRFY